MVRKNNYVTLNYKGHTYVPVRFIGENLGAIVSYDDTSKTIYLNNTGKPDIKDPTDPNVSINNLILTNDGSKTRVNGVISMINGSNIGLGANLTFYNDKGEQIGTVRFLKSFVGEINQFELEGDGDFTNYSSVTFQIGEINHTFQK
jgi:hypothetical protein